MGFCSLFRVLFTAAGWPVIRGSDSDWCEGEGEVAKRGFLSGLTTITIGVDDDVVLDELEGVVVEDDVVLEELEGVVVEEEVSVRVIVMELMLEVEKVMDVEIMDLFEIK